MKLDLLDLKILYELGRDARQTNSQIGKKIKSSQQVVSYRVKNLIETKVIKQFFTTIHFGYFGFLNYSIMIKLNESDKQEKTKFIDYLLKKENLLLLSECGGRWDVIINILAKNPAKFEQYVLELFEEYGELVLNYDAFLTVGGTNFGRKYLFDNKELEKNIPFGKEEKTEISKNDLNILKSISKNARASSIELEEATGINYKTIIKRIKDLKKQRIITSFKPLLDISKLGYFPHRILLDLNKMTEKQELDFIRFLSSKKNIIGTMRMIGKWNYAIGIETKDQQDTWKLYEEIQSYLGDKIKDIELIPIFKKYEYNYFPNSLMKE